MHAKPFQGLSTFLKAPVGDPERAIGVFGVPFDGASSYRGNARFGPEGIRSASKMLTDGAHPLFGFEPVNNVTDMGDIITSNTNVEESLEQITKAVATSGFVGNAEKRLICMGGDHTVTLGILRALAPHHEELQILHFDAHCDTWEDHFGDPIGHGTWVRNVIDEGLVEAQNVIQVGIRSPVDPETRDWLTERGGTVYSARTAMRAGAEEIIGMLRRDCPVYISFDIDALDPAHAPATGTPEIGGLTTQFVLDVLEGLKHHIVVGMDLVEVYPELDPNKVTCLTGASLMWTVAAVMGVQLERAANTPGGS